MLIALTARIFNIVKVKSFKGVLKKLEPGSLQEAEMFWIMQAQKSLSDNWEKCFQRLGPLQAEDGTIMVGQRMERWLKHDWNQDSLILLPGKHPFTVLYINYLHRVDHAGVDVTLCKLQSKFLVPSARKIIRSIKRGCTLCRKLDVKVESQRMGQISDERMSPCPAFYHTAVDIFGHFQIKDNVEKRTTGKAYGVIFNCIVTRAVYIDVVDGYDTYSFLNCFRRFTVVHGYPDTVHSDLGSQLVSVSKELKSDINNWNIHEITVFGAKEGLKWKFNRSADAAWQNGVSEALIKSVKRSLSMLIGTTNLTFSDLQTTFFEIANLMNERPVGLKPGMDVKLGTYLCPNDLLLGRANNKVPSDSWSISGDTKKRLNFIQNVVDTFWHTNAVRGKWKMGQVVDTETGRHNKVRDVSIRYKIQRSGKYKGQSDTVIKRSVDKLVVLLPVEEHQDGTHAEKQQQKKSLLEDVTPCKRNAVNQRNAKTLFNILICDSTNIGLGEVLSLVMPYGTERLIAFASRELKEAEKIHSQIEKEGSALVYEVKKFHMYLDKRKKFTYVTYHEPPLAILGPKNNTAQLNTCDTIKFVDGEED
ncbi:uncharacterized protein [Palaemon carinicauda]|uniref:uncharacterized protein n=1 Tax=Palaemon carinicauda TaxID=392227 RepID=UPI0035B6759C